MLRMRLMELGLTLGSSLRTSTWPATLIRVPSETRLTSFRSADSTAKGLGRASLARTWWQPTACTSTDFTPYASLEPVFPKRSLRSYMPPTYPSQRTHLSKEKSQTPTPDKSTRWLRKWNPTYGSSRRRSGKCRLTISLWARSTRLATLTSMNSKACLYDSQGSSDAGKTRASSCHSSFSLMPWIMKIVKMLK